MADGGGSGAEPDPQLAGAVREMLEGMGVADYEPRVEMQLMEFIHRYISDTLQDAQAYAEHAGRAAPDEADIQLAVSRTYWDAGRTSAYVDPVTSLGFAPRPDKKMMEDLAQKINTKPLPTLGKAAGLRLPALDQALLNKNYQVKRVKKG